MSKRGAFQVLHVATYPSWRVHRLLAAASAGGCHIDVSHEGLEFECAPVYLYAQLAWPADVALLGMSYIDRGAFQRCFFLVSSTSGYGLQKLRACHPAHTAARGTNNYIGPAIAI